MSLYGPGEDSEQREEGGWNPHMEVIDVPAALRLIDQVSDEITTEDTEKACAIVANRLINLHHVEAVGVWLVDAKSPHLVRRSWRTTSSIQPVDVALSARVQSLVRGSEDQFWTRETIQIGEEDRHSPKLISNTFRLNWRSERLGVLAIVTQGSLEGIEANAIKLLVRQLAMQIANARLTTQLQKPNEQQPTGTGTNLSHFIALVAHELRTPLTGLRGNIQLASMAARKADFDKVDTRLSTALRSVDLLTALVQNLQDVSHIERGRFGMTAMPADLVQTLRETVSSIQGLIDLDQYQIELQTPDSLICDHDPTRMKQVFHNLLVNAIRYSPRGGAIQASIEREANSARIAITDHGIGIPDADQPHIFDAYYRGDSAREFNAKGLGIGLTIGRTTVEQHGGRIAVQTTQGKGSTFIIWLPMTQNASTQ